MAVRALDHLLALGIPLQMSLSLVTEDGISNSNFGSITGPIAILRVRLRATLCQTTTTLKDDADLVVPARVRRKAGIKRDDTKLR
jgi:hypothetical protein